MFEKMGDEILSRQYDVTCYRAPLDYISARATLIQSSREPMSWD